MDQTTNLPSTSDLIGDLLMTGLAASSSQPLLPMEPLSLGLTPLDAILFPCVDRMQSTSPQPISKPPAPAVPSIPTTLGNNKRKGAPSRKQSNNNKMKSSRQVPASKNWRLNAQTCFLTFPQTERSKEAALQALIAGPPQFAPIWCMVAQESHKDGAHHLHIVCRFQQKINIRDPHLLDFIGGKHGNYSGVRSVPAVLTYLEKDDPEPLRFGPIPTDRTNAPSSQQGPHKETKSDQVASLLSSGQSIMEIATTHPGYVLQNLKKLQAFQTLLLAQKLIRMSLTQTIHMRILPEASLQDRTIFEWAEKNAFNRDRAFKAQQLYVHGPCNHNKTSFVRKLCEFAKAYCMPNYEQYDDLYDDASYDIAVLDEFQKGQKRSPQFLNQFSDGSQMTLQVKGAQVVKRFNIPFIILSNFSPAECIDFSSLQPFLSRFLVVELKEPIDLSMIHIEASPIIEEMPLEQPAEPPASPDLAFIFE